MVVLSPVNQITVYQSPGVRKVLQVAAASQDTVTLKEVVPIEDVLEPYRMAWVWALEELQWADKVLDGRFSGLIAK